MSVSAGPLQLDDAIPALPSGTELSRAAEDACIHCGRGCGRNPLRLGDKSFCCLGCQTVFSLLTENGLNEFYRLNTTPGSRPSEGQPGDRWASLDTPEVQEHLLDFADATQARVTFHIPAIHCVACIWLLENLFRLHPGIGKSAVQFDTRKVSIGYRRDQVRLSEIAVLLDSIGYSPALTLGDLGDRRRGEDRRQLHLKVGLAGFGFGNIMLLSISNYFGLDSGTTAKLQPFFGWLSLLLALPVITFSASDYWRSAWLSLRHRFMTLDVPIAAGLLAIFGQSLFEVVTGRGEGYFDSLTGLLFFLLCGRIFQQKAQDRLAFDRDYRGFFPLTVRRRTAGAEESVAISQLRVGDEVVLRHGELLPADGNLLEGDALLDYSFVTGESAPVPHAIGAHLYAGGRQAAGAIVVRLTKQVSSSYLASLWDSPLFRKERRGELDTLTNRFSRRFTWTVLAIALGASLFWLVVNPALAAKAFISVLIVACPCALALAAPLAHGTAQRILGARNIHLKNALVIERLAEIDTVVFDKTGTLTDASAVRVGFEGAGLTPELRSLAAELAAHSTHPLARSIAAVLREHRTGLTVDAFEERPGAGMKAMVAGRAVVMGSRAWLADCGTHGDAGADDPRSVVWLAVEGALIGKFILAHELRPQAAEMLGQLGAGRRLALLSGDGPRDHARFQSILGTGFPLEFNRTPGDKLNYIHSLQQTGARVMMVGDGLNDAGALKGADVGVALVEEVGAFCPASDVILSADRLPQLPAVLDFAGRTTRVIRAGFVVSGIYNAVGIAVAAAGLLSPIVCAILMPLSSLTMVLFICGMTRRAARLSGLDMLMPGVEPALNPPLAAAVAGGKTPEPTLV